MKVAQSHPTLCDPMDFSMEFSRPQHWSGYPFPSPGDLPNPGIEPRQHCRKILYQLSHKGTPVRRAPRMEAGLPLPTASFRSPVPFPSGPVTSPILAHSPRLISPHPQALPPPIWPRPLSPMAPSRSGPNPPRVAATAAGAWTLGAPRSQSQGPPSPLHPLGMRWISGFP